jgi:hypothetical protein
LAGSGQSSSQTSYPPSEFASRALISTFSPTYTQQDYELDEYSDPLSNSLAVNDSLPFETIPNNISIVALASIPQDSYELVRYYLSDVLNVQASHQYLEIGLRDC